MPPRYRAKNAFIVLGQDHRGRRRTTRRTLIQSRSSDGADGLRRDRLDLVPDDDLTNFGERIV